MFCPKCGSILLPRKDERKVILACGNCRYTSHKKQELILHEKTGKVSKEIKVIDKKPEVLPKTQEQCPKCDNKEAYYWGVQTRAADEAETRFFKCTQCNHTWRQY